MCFLLSFDAMSCIERKNPLSAAHAFRLAFPKGSERAKLIIKTRNANRVGWQRSRTLEYGAQGGRRRPTHSHHRTGPCQRLNLLDFLTHAIATCRFTVLRALDMDRQRQ